MSEVSTKPYLIRAIHEWCTDQGLTPYMSVVVDHRTLVPRQFVQDGQIVLNVSADATQGLVMGNEMIAFQARFGGVAQNISIPIDNVSAIYARENGHGMAFEVGAGGFAEDEAEGDAGLESTPADGTPAEGAEAEPTPPKGGRSHLKLVK